jgi:hypothetical protein
MDGPVDAAGRVFRAATLGIVEGFGVSPHLSPEQLLC